MLGVLTARLDHFPNRPPLHHRGGFLLYNDFIQNKHNMIINGHEIKPRADLKGANLKGANLVGADLSGADLEGANLWGANLWGANLGGANLKDANLTSANLVGANLTGANLWGADMTGTILEKKEDDKDLKIKELEEELKKYKDTLKSLKGLMDT